MVPNNHTLIEGFVKLACPIKIHHDLVMLITLGCGMKNVLFGTIIPTKGDLGSATIKAPPHPINKEKAKRKAKKKNKQKQNKNKTH